MIETIRHSKYPAISPEEEAISIPLQTLALAIFDAILVRMLQIIAPKTWQPLKHSLCDAFNKNKSQQVINILAKSYDDADVIFIQEAAASFVDHANGGLAHKYMVLRPYVIDGYRNQNSMILARKDKFLEGSRTDLTEQVAKLAGGNWTAPGDLCAVAIKGVDGQRYMLASFHGDTNGLATVPVLKALHEAFTKSYPDHIVIFGLDANTVSDPRRRAFFYPAAHNLSPPLHEQGGRPRNHRGLFSFRARPSAALRMTRSAALIVPLSPYSPT
jgi:hypothetical protein